MIPAKIRSSMLRAAVLLTPTFLAASSVGAAGGQTDLPICSLTADLPCRTDLEGKDADWLGVQVRAEFMPNDDKVAAESAGMIPATGQLRDAQADYIEALEDYVRALTNPAETKVLRTRRDAYVAKRTLYRLAVTAYGEALNTAAEGVWRGRYPWLYGGVESKPKAGPGEANETKPESSTSAEVVTVKYRGPVSLAPFKCDVVMRSSFIERVCYDAPNSYMLIDLSGTWYHYCEIDADTVSGLMAAESMSHFYNAAIKGQFDCRTHRVPQY